jgi:hypothetical protein
MELDLVTVIRHRLLATQEIRQQIEQRAYEFYLERGCRPGSAEQDWLRAEEEVLGPLIRQEMNISWEPESDSPALVSKAKIASPRIKKVSTQGQGKKKATKSTKTTSITSSESRRGVKTTSKSRPKAKSPGKSAPVPPAESALAKEARPKSRKVSRSTTPKIEETQI